MTNERPLTIADRVTILLSEEQMEREDVRLYLSGLSTLIDDLGRRISRRASTIFLAALLFVLLSSGNLTEAEIFNIKVHEFTLFRLCIPVLMAFLSLNLITTLNRLTTALKVFEEVVRQCAPAWARSGLGTFTVSGTRLLLAYHGSGVATGVGNRLSRTTFVAELIGVVLLPVVFSLYAYTSMFTEPRIPVALTAISAGCTLLLTVLGFHNMRATPAETIDRG